MKKLECIIFDVDHGFCAFVKSPNDFGLMIDCGSRARFSPIKWVRNNYNFTNGNIKYFKGRRTGELIISHLHADHFSDVGSFYKHKPDKPKILYRDKKTLKFIDEKIKEEKDEERKQLLQKFKKFQAEFDQEVENEPDWGFDFFEAGQIPYSEAQGVSSDREKIINNRSYIVGIGYAGKKILIPGDIEEKAWEKSFGYGSIKKILKGTNFFCASHHGHKSGVHTDILDYTGIPDIYIISARKGDDSYYDFYSKKENSKGFLIDGDKEPSRVVSTKCRSKSIQVTINEQGRAKIKLLDTEDNLSSHQKKIVSRRTKRVIGDWGF